MDETKNESDLVSFKELYEITDIHKLSVLQIMRFPDLSNEVDSNIDTEVAFIDLNGDLEKEIYNSILSLMIKEVEPSLMGEARPNPSYMINLGIENNDESYGYNILLGDAYINMELLHNKDSMLYVHDISDIDYKKIIDLIENR